MSTSSRWKRFVFFERKNLSLPPLVVRDLVPASTDAPTAAAASNKRIIRRRAMMVAVVAATSNDVNDDAFDPKLLYCRIVDNSYENSSNSSSNANSDDDDEEEVGIDK
jgi:hypothetical protein